MVTIKFPDRKTQDEAVGFLAGRFSGRLFRSGEVIVPEKALEALALENYSFTVVSRRGKNGRKHGHEREKSFMVIIRFPNRESRSEALGFLMSEFYGEAFRTGEVIVPQEALPALAAENFTFTVVGKATHEQMAAIRSHASPSVQRRPKGSAKVAG
jgi:hypothetical protein